MASSGNALPEPLPCRALPIEEPEFPHQSTAGQFFDEDPFEADRALGEHTASDLFSPELLDNQPDPESLANWFGKISSALEDPYKKQLRSHRIRATRSNRSAFVRGRAHVFRQGL